MPHVTGVQVVHGAVQVAKVAVAVSLIALTTDKVQKEYHARKVTKLSMLWHDFLASL